MRTCSILTVAILATSALGLTPADAVTQHRSRYHAPPPFVVVVPPRSFLDPGPVVPVRSLASYVYFSQYPLSMPYSHIGSFGRPPLPEQPVPLIDGLDFGPLERLLSGGL